MNISLVEADDNGNVFINHDLLMTARRGEKVFLPQAGDLIPLPRESELFLLPGRKSIGYDPQSGKFRPGKINAVAAFAAPGYTLSAHPAFTREENAPLLPLFAYGAVGYARGRYWLAAAKVDTDQRQQFAQIPAQRIARGSARLLEKYPDNRLVAHIINNCVRRYDCPAARNFALGRFEAPLPTSRACNATCLGCISHQEPDSPLAATPQCRLAFTPDPEEIIEVMTIHASREKKPIFSFGQGCEGDPLVNAQLLRASIAGYRRAGGKGTINCNTNASKPEAIAQLAEAGLTSLRVSINSAREKYYRAYHRPRDYEFADVAASIKSARKAGVHVSLNLLYFPGFSDTDAEVSALARLCREGGVSMIQLRNLNIDPDFYKKELGLEEDGAFGINIFLNKMREACPWLRFGYFNPYLGDQARILAPDCQ